ncbi:MAG: nuclear transport factor 2 family protein [Pseudomonadota bacterium]
MNRLIAAFAALFVIYPNAVRADDAASIRTVLETQAAAWNRGDIRGFMVGYENSDALRFASGSSVRRGFDETLARYLAAYDTPAKMGTLAFKDLEIDVLSDDAAVVFGRFFLARPEVGDATGLFTLIFRRRDGAWVIVHDHTSS